MAANLAEAQAPAEICSGNAYNIAGGASYTLLDLLALLEPICDTQITPIHADPRSGDVRHSEADIRRAEKDLGYEPEVTIQEGLRHTVKWLASKAGDRTASSDA